MTGLSTSYDTLPKYLVYSGDINRTQKISYGIALKATTGKVLMLKNLHSFSLVTFFKGVYHQAKIPHLVRNMTRKEYNIVISSIDSSEEFDANFNSIHVSNYNEEIRAYARRRLQQSATLLRKCSDLAKEKGSYFYPKGQLKCGEDPLHCAKRELFEETGVNLEDHKHTVRDEIVSSYVTTASGLQYENKIFTIIVDDEICCKVGDKKEVLKVRWI